MKKLKHYFATIGVAALSGWAFSSLAGLVPFLPEYITGFCVLQYGSIVGLLSFCYGVAYIRTAEQRMTQLLLFHVVTLHQLMVNVPPLLSSLTCCVLYSMGVLFGACVSAFCIVAGEADRHLEV